MFVLTKNQKQVQLVKYKPVYAGLLLQYLNGLSVESKGRFGPHPFTAKGIEAIFNSSNAVYAFLGLDLQTGEIIAYSLIMEGCTHEDLQRYNAYGICLKSQKICSYAPSVADKWQGSGLGSTMFDFIKREINLQHYNLMILWGGVQSSNARALNYYKKHGFVEAGSFEHNGFNFDMVLKIR